MKLRDYNELKKMLVRALGAESVVDGYRMGGADARVKRLTEEVDRARLEACDARAREQVARRELGVMRADRDAGVVALEKWGEELKTGKWKFVEGSP